MFNVQLHVVRRRNEEWNRPQRMMCDAFLVVLFDAGRGFIAGSKISTSPTAEMMKLTGNMERAT